MESVDQKEAAQVIASASVEMNLKLSHHPHNQDGGPFGESDRKLTQCIFLELSLLTPECKAAMIGAFWQVSTLILTE
jgi:hypothetical protein